MSNLIEDFLLDNGLIIILCFVILGLICCAFAVDYILDVGLKSIVMSVWDGR